MSNPGPDQNWPHPYERPNQKWSCGRGQEGLPCHLGPDKWGRCKTTAECTPALEIKPGEEKGRYRCTRAPEFGGPCAEGPLPTGACSHGLAPCAPVRNWRSRRGIFTGWVVGLTVAALLLILSGPDRFRFTNPGPVSTAHSQSRSGQNNPTRIVGAENCGACHRSATGGTMGWINAAFGADPGPVDLVGFSRHASLALTSMDRACQDCHRGHNFHHAAGVADAVSCLACHSEHEGDSGLHKRSSSECFRCHGSEDYMRQHGRILAAITTNSPTIPVRRVGLVNSLSIDHPNFAVLESAQPDTNTLRFNHQLHLSLATGASRAPLQCASCHERDAAGAYHRPINYERHCQSCHSLQFDPFNPELHLPHGEVKFAQAFLASLPEQYARFGREVRGITERRALSNFVDEQMRRLQEEQLAGGISKDRIFFSRDRMVGGSRTSNLPPLQVATYYGCAYCHEVSGTVDAPQVAVPATPQRWLTRGSFHHLAHQAFDCAACHEVTQSHQTSDVLLPNVRTCAACHNSRTAPGESCTLCHSYHRPSQ